MKDKIFYSASFGFILGVLLRSFIFLNNYFVFLLITISLAVLLFFLLVSLEHEPRGEIKNKWGITAGIFALLFSFGIFRLNIALKPPPEFFSFSMGEKVSLSGIISDEPDRREDNQKITVETKSGIKILVTSNLEEDFKYGDLINFSGTLKRPDNFTTDLGKEFDYINYLQKDGIFFTMGYPKIEILSRGNGNPIKTILFTAKEKFLEKINSVVQEPESLLLSGLILGEKSSFSESLRQSFVDTGTIHIVALSGYNVTIVAEWIMKIFAFLPRNLGLGAGILSIFLFVLMAGGSSTAVRAGIMAGLALLARLIGRKYDIGRALILAGFLMVLLNPMVLRYDVSFELSFIATVAVIYFSPRIEKYFLWVTPKFGLRDIFSVTCAAYIFVLPFILYKMGNLSLVALPANFLILPFIPFTMVLGFFTGFAGFLSYFLSVPFGYFSYLLLHYELSTISFFSHLPFAAFSVSDFPLILTILIYAYFVYLIFGKSIKNFFQSSPN